MDEKRGLPVVPFASATAWEEWLAEHHAGSPGLWLKIAKRGSGIASVTYPQAVKVALCFGWIDGQKGAFDHEFWLQRFTPRGPRSAWSRVNRDTALELIKAGRMAPAGHAAVEAARRDGRWDRAYEPQGTASVPEDLQRELDRNPAAAAFFATLTGSNRYAVLYRIQQAKRPETRARRIAGFIEKLSRGEAPYPGGPTRGRSPARGAG